MTKSGRTPFRYSAKTLCATCRRWKIKELALFGSALLEDFGPESDVDVVVRFHPDAHWSLWDFYDLQYELETIFKREVDLVEVEGIINPIRRRNILNSMRVVYVA